MTDVCPKCLRRSMLPSDTSFRESVDVCLYRDGATCRSAAAAYQRGLEAGRAERPAITREDAYGWVTASVSYRITPEMNRIDDALYAHAGVSNAKERTP